MNGIWKDLNLKDLIYVAVLLVGIGSTYTAVTFRISYLEVDKGKTDRLVETNHKEMRLELNSIAKEYQVHINKISLIESATSRLDGEFRAFRETNARAFEVITAIQINMAEIKQELRSIRDLMRNDVRVPMTQKR
jgi:hypothetical protein